MKIDVFNHVIPKKYLERMRQTSSDREMLKRNGNIPTLWDIEARLRMIEQFPDLQQVISLASPPIEVGAGPDVSPGLTRFANEEMAEICQKHHDRFPNFIASLPMNNPEAAVAEIDHAIDNLHAAAVQVFSNVNGRPLDEPRFFPIFQRAVERNVTIFVHPARGAKFSDYSAEKQSRYELWWAFGWPYDTSVAMARMVYSGMFDKLPDLRVVTHHMGGMVPYFEGRITPGLDVMGQRTIGEEYSPLKKRPIEYFKKFFADTALFGARAATRCGYEFFGEDQVLFASDCPFDPEGGSLFIRETIRVLDSLELGSQELHKIYELNARKILNL
ncbi:MAG TPA: amidohydrolase family protein [Spirochaetia bacterium]|nr:amidohydrolase family protein [Spirochaetia bacterium]